MTELLFFLIAFIATVFGKHILSKERELSDWAKDELAKARTESESEAVKIEDV